MEWGGQRKLRTTGKLKPKFGDLALRTGGRNGILGGDMSRCLSL